MRHAWPHDSTGTGLARRWRRARLPARRLRRGPSRSTIGPSGVDGLEIPTPSADPDDFVDGIDNPWLPLAPGQRVGLRVHGSERETTTVTVTDETREVQGVTTTVVHDVVTDADGEVVEDTSDWYAQDAAGNVWYFGEDTTEYDERGRPDTAGSWEAGVDGAAGRASRCSATPRVGDGYRQEFSAGVAEDRATVLSLDESVNVDVRVVRRRAPDRGHHAARAGRGRAQVLRPRHRTGLRGDVSGGFDRRRAGRVHPV